MVKETFFSNFACSYLFTRAIPQILIMQQSKSLISKDNTSMKTKEINKTKDSKKASKKAPKKAPKKQTQKKEEDLKKDNLSPE